MKTKIQSILNDINHGLIERDEVLKTALLTVLTGEHLVLIGPPGTAKSAIARRIAECLEAAEHERHFEYLLTKFSTPEEIFGPLSITELKADRFRRNTSGYLPTARVAFLDEIFKANSSILNSLLSILNERIFHNGSEPQRVPLLSLISASNELPVGVEELNALYDRFLVRTVVNPVSQEGRTLLFEALTADAPFNPTARITQADVEALHQQARQVRIPTDIGEIIRDIWTQHQNLFREDRRELLSDRRLVKVLKLLRMSAATNERSEVDLSDLVLLKNCLWNHAENMAKVRELVLATLRRYSRKVPTKVGDAKSTMNPEASSGEGEAYVPNWVSPDRSSSDEAISFPKIAPFASTELLFGLRLKPTGTKTKGFAGSGFAQDPIRITSADDLQAMDDPAIREQGFYFVQTQDIDCAHLTSWPVFAFKGHYDGNGKSIRNLPATGGLGVAANLSTGNFGGVANAIASKLESAARRLTSTYLFDSIHGISSVTHLTLDGCGLAKTIQGSRVAHCTAIGAPLVGSTSGRTEIAHCQVLNGALVNGPAEETTIHHCQVTGAALVNGDTAKKTQINRCQVIDGAALVWGSASDTQISDCAVTMKWGDTPPQNNSEYFLGFIACTLSKGSVVERCFGMGDFSKDSKDRWDNFTHFGGITGKCGNSTIRQCAIGPHAVDLSGTKRIAYEKKGATLDNNAAVDSVAGNDDPNGLDGKTVAAARLNQRFLEDSLGWDFAKVWRWDDANNRPAPRLEAANAFESHTEAGAPIEDLLTRQVLANIWL